MSKVITDTSFEELILDSTAKVMEQAKCVRIDEQALSDLILRMPKSLNQIPAWDKQRHFADGTVNTANWVFVVDTLNFSFWPDSEGKRWTVTWNGSKEKGYWALACSLNRAMGDGVPITNAGFLQNIKLQQLQKILDGSGVIPMLTERVTVLNQIGQVLLEKYAGSFVNLLQEAQGSAQNVIRLVAKNFPCFYDVATYKGENIYFLKRAQILVSDIWGAFSGRGLGCFSDMGSLTAFADYKLPQLLRSFRVLRYSTELAAQVDLLKPIQSGSEQEVEIRSATIQTVDAMRRGLKTNGYDIPAFMIDWWLWETSHDAQHETLPHHRSRTIFY